MLEGIKKVGELDPMGREILEVITRHGNVYYRVAKERTYKERRPKETRFMYIKSTNGKETIVTTLAIDFELGRFGVSYCSNKDQFVKAVGREIALERLKVGDNPYSGEIMPYSNKVCYKLRHDMWLAYILMNPEIAKPDSLIDHICICIEN